MKTYKFWLIAALTATFALTGCEKQSPYDTQSPSDDPLILIPYETETGQIYASATNPDPYVDSVVVIPSAYTTVNWYLDDVLVHTGTKIEKCFPTGTYALKIEAVTTEGKKTSRSGVLAVSPAATDPYVTSRLMAPGITMTIEGRNLDNVQKVILANDFYGKEAVCTIVPTNKEASQMDVTLPAMEDGNYYLCLRDQDTIYGSDVLEVRNISMVLNGFASFSAGEEWVLSGANLQDVASITIDNTVITTFTATATSVTLTAPNLPEGEYTMSIKNKDGSDVWFFTSSGLVTDVKTRSSAAGETKLWEGATTLDWGTVNVRIETAQMAVVPEGATVRVYYELPEAEYHALRITTAWWGDPPSLETDLVLQFDAASQPSPLVFTYDSRCKALVTEREAMLIVGFGVTVTQVTYQ